MKDYNRESRLSFRNYAEHKLRQDLKDEAMETCDPQIKNFATCAQEKGLMVVFSCRGLYRQVQECLALHNGEEAWQRYKTEHRDQLEKLAKPGKPSGTIS